MRFYLIISFLAALLILFFQLLWYFIMQKAWYPELYFAIVGCTFLGVGLLLQHYFRIWRPENPNPIKETPEFSGIEMLAHKFGLSNAEKEVLELLARGLSNKEMADRRFVSLNTIKTHVSRIYGKMGISRRTQLMAMMQQNWQNHPLE